MGKAGSVKKELVESPVKRAFLMGIQVVVIFVLKLEVFFGAATGTLPVFEPLKEGWGRYFL
jgi:hypothetical protein